ncbi:MAG: hypothetical protein KF901_05750 [Myxococcales bacterium]|nr:hypothetical protein [Myxococcales bacterium]
MIELAVGAGLVAVAAFVWRRVHEQRAVEKRKDDAREEETKKPKQRSGPRGLRVGDVLLYANTELWLAGSFELDEEGFVARVFQAPGNDRAPWLVQLDEEGQALVLARDCDEVPGGAVPAELPVGGMRLSLQRRGHAQVRCEGDAPWTSQRAEYVILVGPGGRTLVVVDFDGGERVALFGERTGRELFDFLPGAD